MAKKEVIIEKNNERQTLAEEIVIFLMGKDVTFAAGIEALQDASFYLKKASRNNRI